MLREEDQVFALQDGGELRKFKKGMKLGKEQRLLTKHTANQPGKGRFLPRFSKKRY